MCMCVCVYVCVCVKEKKREKSVFQRKTYNSAALIYKFPGAHVLVWM